MKGLQKWTLVMGLLGSSWVFAQEVRLKERREPGTDRDVEVKLQGGLLTYTGDAANVTAPGASYGVLAATDIVGPIDGELSYQGAAFATDSRFGSQGTLLQNGGQGLLMFSPTLGFVEPYAFSGLGVSRLSVVDEEAAAGLARDATLLKLPVGVGIDWVPAGNGGGEVDLLVGARVQYDVTLAGDAFPTIDENLTSNPLVTTLHVGASF